MRLLRPMNVSLMNFYPEENGEDQEVNDETESGRADIFL